MNGSGWPQGFGLLFWAIFLLGVAIGLLFAAAIVWVTQ